MKRCMVNFTLVGSNDMEADELKQSHAELIALLEAGALKLVSFLTAKFQKRSWKLLWFNCSRFPMKSKNSNGTNRIFVLMLSWLWKLNQFSNTFSYDWISLHSSECLILMKSNWTNPFTVLAWHVLVPKRSVPSK